jgi:hypothetical protein
VGGGVKVRLGVYRLEKGLFIDKELLRLRLSSPPKVAGGDPKL